MIFASILPKSTRFCPSNQLRCRFSNTSHLSQVLYHEWIVEGKVASNTEIDKRGIVLFLHGLLGNGKNLRTPAKKLTLTHPELSALVLDLRGHGRSHQSPNILNTTQRLPISSSHHTIHSCTQDIFETLQALNLTGCDHSPIAVVGHSFGGRCALQYTHELIQPKQLNSSAAANIYPPKHTWLLDTVPGTAHESVAQVVEAISSVPMPIKNKRELVQILTKEKGLDMAIASWMTTNLKKSVDTDGFEFIFDLAVAKSILNDFPKQNFLHMVQDCLSVTKGKNKIHLVIAGKNSAWTEDIVAQLHQMNAIMPENSKIAMEILPEAGHWVHIDDLEGLMNIIKSGFE